MSDDPIIRVEGLGKRYSLRHLRDQRYVALRDVLVEKATGLFRRSPKGRSKMADRRSGDGSGIPDNGQQITDNRVASKEDFWALRNVSFEVHRGEVVGIIGRNGAGKSTLLKILSRITDPTEGRVKLRGRVASLLEVGTGFHPELTGRENIYLNGAILGMSRAEIRTKFDEIVAFAETEKFLDTPVKRYSSGMYVRLAFAVAAHLEPEILVIDEVLAVGDVDFQKKCLGKMRQVATDGRTVLFVTHSMPNVMSLCGKVVWLREGRVTAIGDPPSLVSQYLGGSKISSESVIKLERLPRTLASADKAKIDAVRCLPDEKLGVWQYWYQGAIEFQIDFVVRSPFAGLCVGIALHEFSGAEIASSLSTHDLNVPFLDTGSHSIVANYPSLGLVPGKYFVGLSIRSDAGFEDYLERAFEFEVVPNGLSGAHRVQTFGGKIVPKVLYRLSE